MDGADRMGWWYINYHVGFHHAYRSNRERDGDGKQRVRFFYSGNAGSDTYHHAGAAWYHHRSSADMPECSGHLLRAGCTNGYFLQLDPADRMDGQQHIQHHHRNTEYHIRHHQRDGFECVWHLDSAHGYGNGDAASRHAFAHLWPKPCLCRKHTGV